MAELFTWASHALENIRELSFLGPGARVGPWFFLSTRGARMGYLPRHAIVSTHLAMHSVFDG